MTFTGSNVKRGTKSALKVVFKVSLNVFDLLHLFIVA